jgi:hypothetical protein
MPEGCRSSAPAVRFLGEGFRPLEGSDPPDTSFARPRKPGRPVNRLGSPLNIPPESEVHLLWSPPLPPRLVPPTELEV